MPKTSARRRIKVDLRYAIPLLLSRLRFNLSAAVARIRAAKLAKRKRVEQ